MEKALDGSQWGGSYERRRKTRIQDEIPARVRGVDARGNSFDLEAELENLSACGLYLRLRCRTNCSAPLFTSFRLPASPGTDRLGTLWQTQGVIRRVEPQADGTYGVGVEFTSYHEM